MGGVSVSDMVLGGGGRKKEVSRYRARAAALGRSLEQEDQNNGVCPRQLDEITARVAEAATSLLLRQGGRVGDVARQVRGALLAPHMDTQRRQGVWGGEVQRGKMVGPGEGCGKGGFRMG